MNVATAMKVDESKRTRFEKLRVQLDNDFNLRAPLFRDIGEYILPERLQFVTSEADITDLRNDKIVNITATLSSRTLSAGMMSGVTSPARPWFMLTIPNRDLAEVESVKQWLYETSQDMATMFSKSNLYQTLPTVYDDLGNFATGATLVDEDDETVLRCHDLPIGSYRIANSAKGKVEVFFRQFRLTVRQLIEKFAVHDLKTGAIDWSNFSVTVQSLWERNLTESWIEVCHVIMPNDEYDPGRLESKHKKFLSCYYERGIGGQAKGDYMNDPSESAKLLSEKGYDYFPVLAPRWQVTGTNVYGSKAPGHVTLGDVKQLQVMELRGAQALEKMINPPMMGPTSLKTASPSTIPGGMTYIDAREGMQGFKPVYEMGQFRIDLLEGKIGKIEDRIKRGYYEDLFLMMANDQRSGITATEVAERKEEKLLALGPVLERLNQDLLIPLIDIGFSFMLAQRLIRPAPPELHGMPLNVEFVSMMAQAQKVVGIAGVERFVGFIGQIQPTHPEIADKINTDKLADIYGEMTSVPPGIVRTDEDAAAIRQQRAKAQQAQAQAQMIQQGAQAAKNLSQSDTSGNNALTQLMDQANAGNLAGGP